MALQLSQDTAANPVPQASGTESNVLIAEAKAITEQPCYETPSHSNGGTSAEQEQKPADSEPQADVKDTELQRRKAALLQRVRIFQSCKCTCVSACHTICNDDLRTSPRLHSCLACLSAHEASSIHALVRPNAQVEDALAKADASPTSATGKAETPVDTEIKQISHDSKPEQPEPLHATPSAALPPRKPKLQPGDFYITLPKPPLAEPSLLQAEHALRPDQHTGPETVSAGPVAETSQEENRATGLRAPESTEVFSPGQAADAGSRTGRQGPDTPPHDGCVPAVVNTEAQPSSSADLPGKHRSVPGISEVPVLGPSADSGAGEDAAQQNTPTSTPDTSESFPERDYSTGTRYGAAAARKEAAQELALEQAILVRCPCPLCSTHRCRLKHAQTPACSTPTDGCRWLHCQTAHSLHTLCLGTTLEAC